MKTITSITMANDNDIEAVTLGKDITVKESEGFYTVFEGSEPVNDYYTSEQANEAAKELIIDDDLIVQGYGTHSGRKYWQLPDNLKLQIKNISAKS